MITARLAVMLVLVALPAAARAQDAPPPPVPPPEVERSVVNLPTTMSLARHGGYFRLTHRFARDLGRGDFGSLAADLFSLDNGAVIGLEYRFGLADDLQVAVHRTILSKTIQFFGRFDGWRQGEPLPFALSLVGSVEGLNNMREHHQPAVAVVLSRTLGRAVALYATPAFVANTRAADFLTGHDHDHGIGSEEADEHAGHDHTGFVGLGARVRLRPTVFLSAEISARVAGHDPGRASWGVAVEKKAGGHTFALAFTNSFGTTFGQLARGGSDREVYLGFNIIRRF